MIQQPQDNSTAVPEQVARSETATTPRDATAAGVAQHNPAPDVAAETAASAKPAEGQGDASAAVESNAASRPRSAAVARLLSYLLVASASALVVVIALSIHHAIVYQRTLTGIMSSLRSVESALASARNEHTTYVAAPSPGTTSATDQLLQLAAAAEQESGLPKAEALYREALNADTVQQRSDEIRYRLAWCLVKQGRPADALKELRVVVSAFRNSPFYARAAYELATLHMERGETSQARRVLYQLIALRDAWGAEDREFVEKAHYALARSYEIEADSLAASRGSASALLDAALSRTGKPK